MFGFQGKISGKKAARSTRAEALKEITTLMPSDPKAPKETQKL